MRTTQVMIAFALSIFLAMEGLHEVAWAQQVAADSTPRTWRDLKGVTTIATLVKFEDGVVHLRKQDKTVVSVPIEKLSAADQEYVNKRVGDNKKATTVAPTKSDDLAETSELLVKSERLCEDITKAYKGRDAGRKATVAVMEFSDLSGGATDFGRLLSEELITKLFATGNYKVIERLLLNKAMSDHKLVVQGFIATETAKEIGKILGADAIVSGTVADLGDSLRVNARLISTETGEVLAVAAANFVKDAGINALMGTSGKPTRSGSSGSSSPSRNNEELRLPFREDFSAYMQDDRTNWGDGAKVRVGEDGRNWLVPSVQGQRPIGLDVELPVNSYIEFDYRAQFVQSGKPNNRILSGICLIDETGARHRIEWSIWDVGINNMWRNNITMPGGAPQDAGPAGSEGVGTIRILKRGDKIEVNTSYALIGNLSDFKKITRFEIDLYKGPNTIMSVTNIKVGSLDTSGPGAPRGAYPGRPGP